ncbi:TPA: DUF4123 domain-containing protein [Photobacterium damselae]
MLKQWLTNHWQDPHHHIYAVFNRNHIVDFTAECSSNIQQRALFTTTNFESLIDVTPWVVELNPSHLANPNLNLDNGLILMSKDPIENVVAHLQTLLLAANEGEIVFFRSYEPEILQPMLKRFTPQEIEAFLGNIETMALVGDAGVELYQNPQANNYHRPIESPWWIIKDHHLDNNNLNAQANQLNRYIWHRSPDLVAPYKDSLSIIKDIITEGKSQGFEQQTEFYLLAKLGIASNIDASTIRTIYRLDHDDYLELLEIYEKVA